MNYELYCYRHISILNLFPEVFPRTWLLEVSWVVAKVGEERHPAFGPADARPEHGQPSELAQLPTGRALAAGPSSWPMDGPACTAVKTCSVFTASESERDGLFFRGTCDIEKYCLFLWYVVNSCRHVGNCISFATNTGQM